MFIVSLLIDILPSINLNALWTSYLLLINTSFNDLAFPLVAFTSTKVIRSSNLVIKSISSPRVSL